MLEIGPGSIRTAILDMMNRLGIWDIQYWETQRFRRHGCMFQYFPSDKESPLTVARVRQRPQNKMFPGRMSRQLQRRRYKEKTRSFTSSNDWKMMLKVARLVDPGLVFGEFWIASGIRISQELNLGWFWERSTRSISNHERWKIRKIENSQRIAHLGVA